MWIGIDIAIHAVKRVARIRLRDKLGLKDGTDFMIEGVPRNVEGARDLWQRDPYHFQKWAVESVGGFVTSKRTADKGIDGRLYFYKEQSDKDLSCMVIEVKGGRNINASIIRDLIGTMEMNRVEMAGFIHLEPLGERQLSNYKQAMVQAGDLMVNGVAYPRIQIISVEKILDPKNTGFNVPNRIAAQGLLQPSLINVDHKPK